MPDVAYPKRAISLISPTSSFKRQLLWMMTLGVFSLAITASLTTAWTTSQRAEQLLVTEGLQIADNLGRQCVLAFLYGSGDNAAEAVIASLTFPNVEHVMLFEPDFNILLEQGETALKTLRPEQMPAPLDGPLLVEGATGAWHFVAPVTYSTDEDEDFITDSSEPELLGFVYVAMAKDALYALRASIFFYNVVIALSFAMVLLFLLRLLLQRLTRPLDELSQVMRRAEKGEQNIQANLAGPEEVYLIAKVFNKMMATLAERGRELQQHNELLESEVAIRTHELVLARDAALAGSRHKSEFLANMSHELRTPLQSVIGYTDLVVEELEEEGLDHLSDDLSRVLSNAHHLLSLINDILDMAKIEAGQMGLRMQKVQLKTLFQQAEDTVLPLMKKKGNQLHIIHQDENFSLEIDPGRFLQILLNLMSNAAKFTDQGEVRITVGYHSDLLEVIVKDSGIGMSAEQQSHIFEKFHQVDGSTTRSYEGTGLGLAITRQLCQLLGGDIQVKSEEQKGSSFIVRIPLPIRPEREEGCLPIPDNMLS